MSTIITDVPTIMIQEEQVSDGIWHTFITINGNCGHFTDQFPGRRAAKDWGADVLCAYYDYPYSYAISLINESGCDCEGPTHYTSCWWTVYREDGREQNA